jgi:hypothetical protein
MDFLILELIFLPRSCFLDDDRKPIEHGGKLIRILDSSVGFSPNKVPLS